MTQASFGFDSDSAWTAYIDGGSRGNPGDAGFGVVISPGDKPIVEIYGFLGRQTNNYAEYKALLAALDYSLSQNCQRLQVYSDSELLVFQMQGVYRVKSPGLLPLYQEARAKVARFKQFKITHVRRESNEQADRLANLAMETREPLHIEVAQ